MLLLCLLLLYVMLLHLLLLLFSLAGAVAVEVVPALALLAGQLPVRWVSIHDRGQAVRTGVPIPVWHLRTCIQRCNQRGLRFGHRGRRQAAGVAAAVDGVAPHLAGAALLVRARIALLHLPTSSPFPEYTAVGVIAAFAVCFTPACRWRWRRWWRWRWRRLINVSRTLILALVRMLLHALLLPSAVVLLRMSVPLLMVPLPAPVGPWSEAGCCAGVEQQEDCGCELHMQAPQRFVFGSRSLEDVSAKSSLVYLAKSQFVGCLVLC